MEQCFVKLISCPVISALLCVWDMEGKEERAATLLLDPEAGKKKIGKVGEERDKQRWDILTSRMRRRWRGRKKTVSNL